MQFFEFYFESYIIYFLYYLYYFESIIAFIYESIKYDA